MVGMGGLLRISRTRDLASAVMFLGDICGLGSCRREEFQMVMQLVQELMHNHGVTKNDCSIPE